MKGRTMKPIKYAMCCCAVLALLITACDTTKHASGPALAGGQAKAGQLTESEIQESRIYRRAVEAAIWSQPLMERIRPEQQYVRWVVITIV